MLVPSLFDILFDFLHPQHDKNPSRPLRSEIGVEMSRQVVTCQLPGCARVMVVSDDEPTPRKYCCADHRAAARRLRHQVPTTASTAPEPAAAMMRDAPAPVPATTVATYVEVPPIPSETWPTTSPSAHRAGQLWHGGTTRLVDVARRCPAAVAASFALVRKTWRATTMRQRRMVAVLGATGILVVGGGLVTLVAFDGRQAPSVQPESTPEMAMAVPPSGMTEWARAAAVDLESVRIQLAEVTLGEGAWGTIPDPRRTGPVLVTFTQLELRKALLQHEETMLQTGLTAVDGVHRTSSEAGDAQAQLAGVQHQIAVASTQSDGDGQPAAARARLFARQGALTRQCDALDRELIGWIAAVRMAMAAGLPDPTDGTLATVNVIVDVSRQSSAHQAPATPPTALADARPQRASLAAGATAKSIAGLAGSLSSQLMAPWMHWIR